MITLEIGAMCRNINAAISVIIFGWDAELFMGGRWGELLFTGILQDPKSNWEKKSNNKNEIKPKQFNINKHLNKY